MEHRKSGWYFVESQVPATYRLRRTEFVLGFVCNVQAA